MPFGAVDILTSGRDRGRANLDLDPIAVQHLRQILGVASRPAIAGNQRHLLQCRFRRGCIHCQLGAKELNEPRAGCGRKPRHFQRTILGHTFAANHAFEIGESGDNHQAVAGNETIARCAGRVPAASITLISNRW